MGKAKGGGANCFQWMVGLALVGLHASFAEAQATYPPLVPEGEVFEGVEALLANVSREFGSYAVAFSPDGETLGSASNDTVHLWNVATGRLIHRLEGHSDRVRSIAFSPTRKILASASVDRTVWLWKATTGEPIRQLEVGSVVSSVAFSPNGKILASAADYGTVHLWDVATGELMRTMEDYGSGVSSLTFSPDGTTLASALMNNTVQLRDIATGKKIQSFEGHGSGVRSVAFSPNGKTLAAAAHDGVVHLWNLTVGEAPPLLEGHGSEARSVAFSPNGETIASVSGNGLVRLWDAATSETLRLLEGHAPGPGAVAFSPDGKTLASKTDNSALRLWDVATGEVVRLFDQRISRVLSVAFSPDGKILASASADHIIRLWNVANGELANTLARHKGNVNVLAFSPESKHLASASEDHTVGVWDVDTGKLIRVYSDQIFSVAFSADGTILMMVSDNGTVRLWDFATNQIVHSLKDPLEDPSLMARVVAFSPDGTSYALAVDNDPYLMLWDVASGDLIRHFEGMVTLPRSLAFSTDGQTLALASSFGRVGLWNVSNGQLTHRFNTWLGAKEHLSEQVANLQRVTTAHSVAFSPDGETLAVTSYDHTVGLWDLISRSHIRTLKGQSTVAPSIAFSPDGKTLAFGSTEIMLHTVSDDFKPTAIFIGGRRGTWVSCQLGNRCLRHDDGTLFRRRREDGAFESVPPQVVIHPPQLELAEIHPRVETLDGESATVTLPVRNTGKHRAYWLGVRHVDDPKDDPLVVALPWNRPFLDPGEQADLQVRVSTHSAYDHPRTTDSKLSLEITSLHGEPIQVPEITIHSRVPSLEWKRARWVDSGGTRNLTVELTHTGNMTLENVELTAQLSDLDASLPGLWGLPVTPGETIPVPFGLPKDAPTTADTRVTVTARSLGPPPHAWTFTDQSIRPATPAWILPATVATALMALTFLSLFGHPLVRQLSKRPTNLLQRPPPDLPKARTLLRLTGRLGSVLRDADVERGVLDRAIDFWDTDSEARFRRLAERLGVVATYTDDTKSQTLPLGAAFPLNLERCLIHQPPAERPASEALAWLKARPETRDQVTLAIAADADAQDNLHRLAGNDPTNLLVVPSGVEMTEILLSPESNQALARIIASQVRRTHVSPYQTGGGVSRESIFFGREEILAHILSRELSSYLIVGGRQLGKTSLLQAIRRRLDDDPRIDVRYLALSGSNLSSALARSLRLPRTSGLDAVLERLAASERHTLFLIDEADVLVSHQHRRLGEGEDGLFTQLRSLSEEGRCHFILTGFWSLYEAAVLDYGSPLRNFGETLRLEALEADACVRLATEPMASMGLSYEEGAVARLVERTGRRANLIAIACNEIIKSLEPTVRTIDRARVDAALAGKAVQDALEGWQRLASEDGSRLDRAVVYATIDHDSFTLANVLATLREAGADIDVDRLERSLRRLELAWVIGEDDGTYTFRVPLFVERVRGQDPSLRLQEEARKLA